jgi:hypothetical protein
MATLVAKRKEKAMEAKTKKARLLSLMKRQWTTPLEALEQTGNFALSQRAGEFAREGWNVAKKWVELPSGSRVRSYRIVGRG